MSLESLSDFDLLAKLRGRNDPAAAELFRRYKNRLFGLARERLGNCVRQKVDPEDVLQSVFRTFFRRTAEGEFEVGQGEELWDLLAVVTANKCSMRLRYFRAKCRTVECETPFPEGGQESAGDEIAGDEPSPEEVAVFHETLERLVGGLEDRDRGIVELRFQGYTYPEIAEKLGISERKVEFLLTQIRRRLNRWLAEN
jgi:RNA polymerase sigma factor (sigma-70 family)